jgi:hypothetical protein
MSETTIVPGQWFYETVGKTWFIVHDYAGCGPYAIELREPDTGAKNYVKWSERTKSWLPAKMNDEGVFYIVKAKYGNFEFRGDDGPSDAQIKFLGYTPPFQASAPGPGQR